MSHALSADLGFTWRENEPLEGPYAFATLRERFSAASSEHPEELCVSSLEFAGRRVQLRVLGRDLHAHLLQPFAHLASPHESGAPALKIDVWDANIRRLCHQATTQADAEWSEVTVQSVDGAYIGQRLPNTVSCLDRRAGHLVAVIDWHRQIFIYERAKPWARLLLNWYNDRGLQLVHTALVARGDTGIMLAGKSGSGKSTTSLACLLAGFDFLAEDYVAVEAGPSTFVGHSVYNSVFLETGHLTRFPELAAHVIRGRPPQELKSVVVLSSVLPQRLRRSVRISALVFPQVGPAQRPALRPISKGAALLSLAPSSLLQIPNRQLGASGFERLAQLAERLPCYGLTVGPDLAALTARLDDLCAELGS